MPLLFRCLRHFRRGALSTWPGKDVARSTANRCAAAQIGLRSASSANTAHEGSQPGSPQVSPPPSSSRFCHQSPQLIALDLLFEAMIKQH